MRHELDNFLFEIEELLKGEDQEKLDRKLEQYQVFLRSININSSNAEIMRDHSNKVKEVFEKIREKKEGIKRITLQETKQNNVVNRFSRYE